MWQVPHRRPAAHQRRIRQRRRQILRITVACAHLHGARRGAATPDADRPEGTDAALCQKLQLLIGDLVKPLNRRAVALGELREPDEEMLRLDDDLAHPRGIVAVARWLRGAEGRLLPANHRNASDLCRLIRGG